MKGHTTMTSTNTGEPPPPHATPVAELVPGDRVRAWVGEVLHYAGTVETVAIELGVIWIREDGIGARTLLDVGVYRIHRTDPSTSSASQ
jgi:hypothetical protein